MKSLKSIYCLLVISLVGTSVFSQKKPIDIVTQYFANTDKGDVNIAAKHFSPAFKAKAPFSPTAFDAESWKMVGMGFKQAFPDMVHNIENIFTDGHYVAVKGNFIGTNSGPMMGKPASGNKVTLPFNTIFSLDKSLKILSINVEFDQMNFNNQLIGINPTVSANAETTIRELIKAVDAADEIKIKSLIEPDAIHYFQGQKVTGDDLIKRSKAFKLGFPDIERRIDETIVSGTTVTLKGAVTGTNKGIFMGMKPTGAKVEIPFLAVYKLSANGKMKEGNIEFDRKTAEHQIAGMKVSPEVVMKNILTAYESLNKRDWNIFKTVCNADEYTEYSAGPNPIKGLDNAINAYKPFFEMFPDYNFILDKIILDGNRVIVESTAWGTNTNKVMGMFPPTGKKIKTHDIEIITLDAYGKATSHLTINPNEVFHQIGYGSLSNPNSGIVMDIYKNFGNGNIEAVVNHLATSLSFDVRDNPVAKTKKIYSSNTETKMFFAELMASCDVTRFEPYKIVADGDHVMAAIKVEWKLKSNGKQLASDFTHHFKIENGKVVWFQETTTPVLEVKGM